MWHETRKNPTHSASQATNASKFSLFRATYTGVHLKEHP